MTDNNIKQIKFNNLDSIFSKLFHPIQKIEGTMMVYLNVRMVYQYSNYLNLWSFLKNSWFEQDFRKQNTTSDLLSEMFVKISGFMVNTIIQNERVWEAVITNIDNFTNLLDFFKNSSFFQMSTLTDIWGREVLYYKTKQISLVYNLISDITDTRFLFKVLLTKTRLVIPTLMNIYPSANWAERECWDMLGVIFLGHIDLRRILTDYGFLGYPLRKEFPLTGFLEVRYSDVHKRVVFEPVELPQELRFFDFSNPWNFNVVSNKKLDYITSSQQSVDVYDVLSQESVWQTSLTHLQSLPKSSAFNLNKVKTMLGMPTSYKSINVLYNSFNFAEESRAYFMFNPFIWGDFFSFLSQDDSFLKFIKGDKENEFFLSYILNVEFSSESKFLSYYYPLVLQYNKKHDMLNSLFNPYLNFMKHINYISFLGIMSSNLRSKLALDINKISQLSLKSLMKNPLKANLFD